MARPAPAVTKAVALLDLLVTHPTQRFTISELARRTSMSLGSAHAVLAVLESRGHVSRDPVSRAYTLGPALVVAGVVALEHHPAIDAARELIAPLAAELDAEVVVSARTSDEIIFVATAGTPAVSGPAMREGERVPLVPPFGAVFMAWADSDEVEQWLQRTPEQSPTAIARSRAALALVRARGFSATAGSDAQRLLGERTFTLTDDPGRTDLRDDIAELLGALANEDYAEIELDDDRRFDLGIVAAPVFGPDGRVLVAITATGFATGVDAARAVEIGRAVRECAALVTRRGRGRPPA